MNCLSVQVVGGPFAGADKAVSPGESLRVGRGDACDLSVIDPILSREHFELTQEGGQYLLRDLRSRNGTRLNDRVLAPSQPFAEVQHGDLIKAGCTTFRVRFDGSLPVSGNGSAKRRASRPEEFAIRDTWEHDET